MADASNLQTLIDKWSTVVEKNIPTHAVLQRLLPFKSDSKNSGGKYIVPVLAKRPYGFTFAGASTAKTTFTINAADSMEIPRAEVEGAICVLQEEIAKSLIDRGSKPLDAVEGDQLNLIMGIMWEAVRWIAELSLMYGRTSIGTVANTTGTSGTTLVIQMTKATWSPGLWAGGTGMPFDVFTAPDGTQRNANAAFKVTSIDAKTGKVTASGDSTDVAAVVAGDVVVFRSSDGQMLDGIDKILTNAGTLFGIDAAAKDVWLGSSYDNSGARATLATFLAAQAQTCTRGGMVDLDFLVPTFAYNDLVNDAAGLQRIAEADKGKIKKLSMRGLEYEGPGGVMRLHNAPLCKQGESFGLHLKSWRRGGAHDVRLARDFNSNNPKLPPQIFTLENKHGYGARMDYDQYVISKAPAKSVKITGIVSSADVGA